MHVRMKNTYLIVSSFYETHRNCICAFLGMGVRILLDIIRIVQPSHVVQINLEPEPIKNLPLLNEEFLLSEEGWAHQVDKNRWVL